MATQLEYVLTLKDQITGKLSKMKIINDEQLAVWGKVQSQVNAASNTMTKCGVSIASLNQRISALRAERDWIPANKINTIRRYNVEIKGLEKQLRQLNSVNGGSFKNWISNLQQSIPILNALSNPLMYIGMAFYKIGSYMKESAESWDIQEQAEIKLATIMRQRMKASDGEIESIKRLTSAQQKLGIIGDEVQLSGAQQLGTFLKQKTSLEKLIPAMNNLLAQQKGYKATAEDATQIGNLMGKVMQGQIGALTRVGITFTAAQEKVLKYGNEQQKAATLAQVITDNVGQMNKALTNTPAGALKQHANAMGDLKERIGKMFIEIKSLALPLMEIFAQKLEHLIVWFEKNKGTIQNAFSSIIKGIGSVINVVSFIFGTIGGLFAKFFIWIGQGGNAITIFTIAITALAGAIALCKLAHAAWNLVMYASPITWIIAGIVALIAVISFVCSKIKGWGTLWHGVINGMKYILIAFVDSVKLRFGLMVNSFLIGIDNIRLGWYKFKEAVGLGDSSANQAALKQINADIDARKKAITDAGKKVVTDTKKVKESFGSINLQWDNSKKVSDVTKGLKNKLGLGTNDQLQASVGNAGGGVNSNAGGGNVGGASQEAITQGGQRSTNIKIEFKNLIEKMTFSGGFAENKSDVESQVAEAMFRVLNIAQSSVS